MSVGRQPQQQYGNTPAEIYKSNKTSESKVRKTRKVRSKATSYFKQRTGSFEDSDQTSASDSDVDDFVPFPVPESKSGGTLDDNCTDDERDNSVPKRGLKKRKRAQLERGLRRLYSIKAAMVILPEVPMKLFATAFLQIYITQTPNLPTASLLTDKVNSLLKDEELLMNGPNSEDVGDAPTARTAGYEDLPDGHQMSDKLDKVFNKDEDSTKEETLKYQSNILDSINALTSDSTPQEVFSIFPELPDLYRFIILLSSHDCSAEEYRRTEVPTDVENTTSNMAEMKARIEALASHHQCVVCRKKKLKHVCVPCGHVMCNTCVKKETEQCNYCGEHVELVAQVFTV